jgi:hypothetical protein
LEQAAKEIAGSAQGILQTLVQTIEEEKAWAKGKPTPRIAASHCFL